jgi:hypothetical protein
VVPVKDCGYRISERIYMSTSGLPLRAVAWHDVDYAAIAVNRLIGHPLEKMVCSAARDCGVCRCQVWRRCDICQETICTLVEKAREKIRKAVAGDIPRTKSGELVREWVLIAEFLTSPEADLIDVEDVAGMLRRVAENRADPDTPPWVRALWAQLVNYPCKHLPRDLPRLDRIARGMPARPERAISELDVDDVTRSALREFFAGAYSQVADPYALPKTQQRYDLSEQDAADALNNGLRALGEKKPDAYASVLAVVRYTTGRAPRPRSGLPVDPETNHLRGGASPASHESGYSEIEDRDEDDEDDEGTVSARETIIKMIEEECGENVTLGHRKRTGTGFRLVGRPGPVVRTVDMLVGTAYGRTGNVATLRRRSTRRSPRVGVMGVRPSGAESNVAETDIADAASRTELERLAGLVCAAGVAWTDALLASIVGPPPKPTRKRSRPRRSP